MPVTSGYSLSTACSKLHHSVPRSSEDGCEANSWVRVVVTMGTSLACLWIRSLPPPPQHHVQLQMCWNDSYCSQSFPFPWNRSHSSNSCDTTSSPFQFFPSPLLWVPSVLIRYLILFLNYCRKIISKRHAYAKSLLKHTHVHHHHPELVSDVAVSKRKTHQL